MRNLNSKSSSEDHEQRDRIQRIHNALSRIDGLAFDDRFDAIARHRISKRELAAWETLSEIYYRHTPTGLSESQAMALATLLLIFTGDLTARLRLARQKSPATASATDAPISS